jgi:hypothetical protein
MNSGERRVCLEPERAMAAWSLMGVLNFLLGQLGGSPLVHEAVLKHLGDGGLAAAIYWPTENAEDSDPRHLEQMTWRLEPLRQMAMEFEAWFGAAPTWPGPGELRQPHLPQGVFESFRSWRQGSPD